VKTPPVAEPDPLPPPQRPVDDPHEADHAAVDVVPGVEEERLERRLRIAGGGRDVGDNPGEQLVDPEPGLGRDKGGPRGVEADDLFDLRPHPLRVGGGNVDLVDHRQQLEAAVDGEVGVGERLRLDPLGGVDDEQRPFAGGERAGDLVAEVDVAGGVDQVEDVLRAVGGPVVEPHRAGLDRDPALPLELHIVEHLRLQVAAAERTGALEQAVGERRLAVVDVGDDREVADPGGRRHRELAAQ